MRSRSVKPFLDLCRVSNLPTVWTNVLAAALVADPATSWAAILLLAVSLSFFYTAGMCLNDIFDREIDGLRRPSRPLPSGRVTVRAAYTLTATLFAAALALLLFAPYREAAGAGLALLLLIVLYDKLHKAHPFSIVLMALCRFMVFIIVSIAITGSVAPLAAMAGAVQFVYTLVISAVARHENTRQAPYPLPLIPLMIAGISLIDGIVMALLISPAWLAAGAAGAAATLLGQKYVRGD